MTNFIKQYTREIILIVIIVAALLIHFLDLLDESMMFSGFIAMSVLGYITTLFSENINDERDEHIRYKTNRYLFIITNFVLLISIIYKIFTHLDYTFELLLLTALSLSKIIIHKTLTLKN